jgi:hypothetical protein
MPFDWNACQAEFVEAMPEFAKLSPDSLKGYQTLSASNAKNSLLGEKGAAVDFDRGGGDYAMRWVHYLSCRCGAEGGR